jgi:putative ATP-binding cassette transporter
MSRFRGRLIPRFLVLSKPYLVSDEKWRARGLLTLLVVLMLANTAATVLLNQQAGEFSSALAARESDRYWRSIYFTIGLVAIAVPVYGFYYLLATVDDDPLSGAVLQQHRLLQTGIRG